MNKRVLLTLLTITGGMLLMNAQTSHIVEVFGGGFGNPAPAYDPQDLVISAGDTVRWVNSQGTHNVYGEADDFPDNPVEFSSGSPVPAPWTYEKVFTVVGTYGYHCTQGNHSQTQFGTVTVNPASSLSEEDIIDLEVFPNPAADRVSIRTDRPISSIEIYDIEHRLVRTELFSNSLNQQFISTFDLDAGLYIVRVITHDGQSVKRMIKN